MIKRKKKAKIRCELTDWKGTKSQYIRIWHEQDCVIALRTAQAMELSFKLNEAITERLKHK